MSSGGRKAMLGDLCEECKLPIDKFNAVFKGIYLQIRCRECFNKWHNSLPSRTQKARRIYWRNWKFGISPDEYNKKLELQLKGCAICKKPNKGSSKNSEELAIDHNHKTNQIRDLLCFRCNLLVGFLEEDENIVIEAIEYLKRHVKKLA